MFLKMISIVAKRLFPLVNLWHEHHCSFATSAQPQVQSMLECSKNFFLLSVSSVPNEGNSKHLLLFQNGFSLITGAAMSDFRSVIETLGTIESENTVTSANIDFGTPAPSTESTGFVIAQVHNKLTFWPFVLQYHLPSFYVDLRPALPVLLSWMMHII